jgi:hypothetical protein
MPVAAAGVPLPGGAGSEGADSWATKKLQHPRNNVIHIALCRNIAMKMETPSAIIGFTLAKREAAPRSNRFQLELHMPVMDLLRE